MPILARKTVPLQPSVKGTLSERDFERIVKLVDENSGIQLSRSKKTMIEGRLRKRIVANKLNSFEEYCDLLFDGEVRTNEVDFLIDCMTTNKTDFFREPSHFTFLAEKALPDLIGHQQRVSSVPLIKVWSAASSTGAEAYTTAMVLHEQMELRRDFQFAVLGTDISSSVLEQARKAVFPVDMMSPVPERMRKRYVMHPRKPTLPRVVRIAPSLRRLCRFQYLNLMDTSYPIDQDVDVIFLRNVLIYFEKDAQEQVVERLYGHLRKGGFLFIGHSESMIGSNLGYKQVARAVYQRQ